MRLTSYQRSPMGNVTMSHVAEYAGVSQATVSFVLNGRERPNGSIGQETRLKVLEAAERLGYQPNRAARTLATGTTQRIALWTRFLRDSSYHSSVIPILAEILAPSPYELEVNGVVFNQPSLPQLGPGMVDGIIAFELEHLVSKLQSTSKAKLPPFVNVGTTDFIECGGDFVSCDLRGGADAAMAHLLGSGAARIAFFTAAETRIKAEPRYAAYQAAMESAGLCPEVIEIPLGQHGEHWAALETMKAYLESNQLPEAIFCVNDAVALGAYRAMRDSGVRIPEDVLLVGCNDHAELRFMDCPISTIRQPVAEMCATAWTFLQNRLAEADLPPQQMVLPATFIARASSRSSSI